MSASPKTLIIGGGVIGLNIALALQAAGHEVRLCDDGNRVTSASYGNAGHIATEQVDPLASMAVVRSAWKRWFVRGGALSLPPQGFGAWMPFSLRLLVAAQPARFARGKAALKGLLTQAMPAWQRRVADISAPDLLREDGHFVVWESAESAARGLRSWSSADTGTASLRPVTEDEMSQLSALTRRKIHGAIRFAGTAQISDTRRMLETLEDRFGARGGVVVTARAVALVPGSVRLSDGTVEMADNIIVAAGIGSKPLLEQTGLKVPMIAERGYHIQSGDHGWPSGFPPVVFEDRSMIVTGFERGLRAASFVEFNRPDAAPDPRKWARLRHHVGELGLPFTGAGDEWIGIRPTLPDYLPAIGKVSDGLYYAFGHQHLGLTLGAVTGEIVAAMILSGQGPQDFDLKRFQ
ncbi:FAD-dependent oxidoreductase [Asticcacaulis sp. 201]|uniref:FAD-binding oxidoreductase n=1 Tax=Asticcacaulis sp. 201 TaxID=3028787 RepID=UPI002916FE56|nr:FAD-dependent oxidoreductase [Asticcacaulis sp. 201]MDV6330358.1 FAD-dependent oxidoreductase [Asticcacaulis sp. 201]